MLHVHIGRRQSHLCILLALIVYTTALSACDGGGEPGDSTPEVIATPTARSGPAIVTVRKGSPIRIGVSTALSTDNAATGLPIRASIEFALKQHGPVQDFSIELLAEDDACTGPGSMHAATELITAGVVAVLGPMCSGGAVAALDTYDDAGVLVISGSADAAPVTEQGVEGFFRTAWSEATQGGEIARYAFTTLNSRRAALVHDGSLYGISVTDLFKDVFTASGGEVLVEAIVTGGAVDLSRIESAAPDLVVYAGRDQEAAALISKLRAAGVRSLFFGADDGASQNWIDDAEGAAEGAYVSRGFAPADGSRYATFAASFAADQGSQPGEFTEYYFDAATIVLAAIAAVGVLDADGNLMIDEERLIAEVRASRLEGVSGTIQFDDAGDRVVTVGIVHRIDKVQDGAFVRVQ